MSKGILMGVITSSFLLGFSTIPQMSWALEPIASYSLAENGTENVDFLYEEMGSEIKITAYLGNDSEILIPESINGKIVSAIGNDAFHYCDSLVTVVLPDTILDLGTSAFGYCTNLRNFYVCESIISVGVYLFEGNDDIIIYGAEYQGDSQYYETIAEVFASNYSQVPLVATSILTETPSDYYDPEENLVIEHSVWATPHVEKARNNQLITKSLYNIHFSTNILRFQIADVLVNFVEKVTDTTMELGTITFTDTDVDYVLKANKAGIVSGLGDGSFGLMNLATREQIAVMMLGAITEIERISGKTLITRDTELEGYVEQEFISNYAKEAMAIMVNNGIMTGVEEGNLASKSSTTIEQVIVMMNRIYDLAVN